MSMITEVKQLPVGLIVYEVNVYEPHMTAGDPKVSLEKHCVAALPAQFHGLGMFMKVKHELFSSGAGRLLLHPPNAIWSSVHFYHSTNSKISLLDRAIGRNGAKPYNRHRLFTSLAEAKIYGWEAFDWNPNEYLEALDWDPDECLMDNKEVYVPPVHLDPIADYDAAMKIVGYVT